MNLNLQTLNSFNKYFYFSFLLVFNVSVTFFSCKKDDLISKDASVRLSFSSDTIIFDTVFTSIGSTVRILKLYNTENRKIIVSSIRLGGGSTSAYKLNIDGIKKDNVENIEIGAKDSLYIFVMVNINPNNASSPMIIADSIMFLTNGNQQKVDLVAWGQDAHYIRPNRSLGFLKYSIIAGENEIVNFESDKPYVIYGYAVVDSSAELIIPAGARLHFYKNSGLWIYRGGKLKVNGTKENPVLFTGTRLEADYRNLNGQWDRIWVNEGASSSINYAVIQNAFIGIQAETIFGRWIPDETSLNITNTIIKNMSAAGILSRYFTIRANNNLIYNCGGYCAALTFGGNYSFVNSTFANFWSFPIRKTPAVFINNYNEIQDFPLDSAYFANCIIDGNNSVELQFDRSSNTAFSFNFLFKNSLIKTENSFYTSNNTSFINCINNSEFSGNGSQNRIFKDVNKNDYALGEESPARQTGDFSLLNLFNNFNDIKGIPFKNPPSMGAYEIE